MEASGGGRRSESKDRSDCNGIHIVTFVMGLTYDAFGIDNINLIIYATMCLSMIIYRWTYLPKIRPWVDFLGSAENPGGGSYFLEGLFFFSTEKSFLTGGSKNRSPQKSIFGNGQKLSKKWQF